MPELSPQLPPGALEQGQLRPILNSEAFGAALVGITEHTRIAPDGEASFAYYNTDEGISPVRLSYAPKPEDRPANYRHGDSGHPLTTVGNTSVLRPGLAFIGHAHPDLMAEPGIAASRGIDIVNFTELNRRQTPGIITGVAAPTEDGISLVLSRARPDRNFDVDSKILRSLVRATKAETIGSLVSRAGIVEVTLGYSPDGELVSDRQLPMLFDPPTIPHR